MEKLTYNDIVYMFLGQCVFLLQARFDSLPPRYREIFARELIRWLKTHVKDKKVTKNKKGAKNK